MESRVRRNTGILLIVTLFASTVVAPLTALAGTSSDDLKQIEYKYYFRGKYQQTIESLQTFLARVDLTPADATRAREVLAASYVLGGAPMMGKQVFGELIAKDPTYAGPDPNVFKLEVVDAYAQARSDYAALALTNAPQSAGKKSDDEDKGAAAIPSDGTVAEAGKPIYKKWWFYAGAAALIAGIGVAAGGGSDTPPPADSGGVTVGVTVH
jgi:hypothetical protein